MIDIMTRTASGKDVSRLLSWAEMEGWNPGIDDARAFHAADQEGVFVGSGLEILMRLLRWTPKPAGYVDRCSTAVGSVLQPRGATRFSEEHGKINGFITARRRVRPCHTGDWADLSQSASKPTSL